MPPTRIVPISPNDLDALDAFALSVGDELRDVLLGLSQSLRAGADVAPIDEHSTLTPNQVAQRLGMSRTHLYKLLDRGEIASHRVGRDRRIYARDVFLFEVQRQHDRRELAERFAHQDRTRAAALDEITRTI
jgi:excisionase family DNA binding protein